MKLTPQENAQLSESLKRYKPFGMKMLQALALLATTAILITILYEFIR